MSKVKIQGNASGTGVVTLSAPDTSTDRTIILPDADVTLGGGVFSYPEGTAILSTGETGGTKFLREDGDGTCSWQAAGGGGGIGEFIGTSIAISSDDTALANDDGTSNGNIGMGPNALNATTIGNSNIALGDLSTKLNVSGSYNVALGRLTNYSNTANGNIAIGNQALMQNTSGQYNIAVGAEALNSTGTASYNIGIGSRAGQGVSTGTYNALTGYEAGKSLTTGSYNVAFGYQSLTTNTTASNNVAVGSSALNANTTSSDNTAIGRNAGLNATGASNTFIGKDAGDNLTTGNHGLYIGQYAVASASGVNYEMVLTSSNANKFGKGAGTGFIAPGGGGVYQYNNSSSWSTTSDERLKKNIADSTIGLAEINQLQVRNFEYRLPEEIEAPELSEQDAIDIKGVQVGVIAQEVELILPKCVKQESTGVKSVDTDNLIWHLVKAIQELSAKNDALEARITTLEG